MRQMRGIEAKDVIEDGLAHHYGAEITTSPTEEQRAALATLSGSADIAPRMICDTLDLDQGSYWSDVVAAINSMRFE